VLEPHGGGLFQFPPSFVPNVLFSTHHGWFTWTPIALLCVLGLLYGCYVARTIFVPLTIVLFLQVALVGSLRTQWPMGEAFGMRALTCTLAIPALGLAWFVFRLPLRELALVGALVVFCTVYSLVFAAQYRLDLLPKQDWLTSEELLRDKIFLKETYDRHKQVRLANALLGDRRVVQAINVLETAERRHGESRFLLEALTQAYTTIGNETKAAETRERLQTLLMRRLY
jgi:hypothetical protein